MKTAELTGELLDHWVAKAEGKPFIHYFADESHGELHFSTDWAQGGPIIERERIALTYDKALDWSAFHDAYIDIAGYQRAEKNTAEDGPTPLIAAMRAYVASKFGEEVPDEIT